jgi:hypothetical protein
VGERAVSNVPLPPYGMSLKFRLSCIKLLINLVGMGHLGSLHGTTIAVRVITTVCCQQRRNLYVSGLSSRP